MKLFRFILWTLLSVLFLLISCAPKAAVPETVLKSVSSTPAISREPWQERWEKLLQEAKKEGVLTMYNSAGGEVRDALTKPLQEKLGLRLEYVTGRGAEISQRLLSERRSGIYLADIYLGGSTTIMTQLKPNGMVVPLDEKEIFLPEALDPKSWYWGELHWKDKDHTTISFINFAVPPVTVNTNLVGLEEIKSYRDLLNPRWKGKITMNDPTTAGIGLRFFLIVGGKIMGYDYMKELARQQPVILRDQRQQVEWLAQGKYPIGTTTQTNITNDFQRAGAPLAYVQPVEGGWTSSGSGNVALYDRAPHPRAARAFINWLLTKEGQSIFVKGYGAPSARLDLPVQGLDPATLVKPGVKYIEGDAEEIELGSVEQRKLAVEIFTAGN